MEINIQKKSSVYKIPDIHLKVLYYKKEIEIEP